MTKFDVNILNKTYKKIAFLQKLLYIFNDFSCSICYNNGKAKEKWGVHMETVKMEVQFLVAGSLPSDEVLIKEFKERFEKSCTSKSRLAIISEIKCQNNIETMQHNQAEIQKLNSEIQRLQSILSDIKVYVNKIEV